jgi:DNA-directed RNA polymerase subunit omega
MMIYPAIAALLEKVDSRYTLVIETAKRARQLTDGAPKLTSFESNKNVTIAVHEIYEGKVEYYRNKTSLK